MRLPHVLDPFRDQRARGLQTLLTISALAAVVWVTGSGLRVQAALQDAITSHDPDISHVIGAKSSAHALYGSALRAGPWTPDVIRAHQIDRALDRYVAPRWHAPLIRFAAVEARTSFAVYGVDERFWERPAPLHAPRLASGRLPQPDQAEAVLGAHAARALRVTQGETLQAHTPNPNDPTQPLAATELTVVGILAPGSGWDRALLTDVQTARRTLPPLLNALEVIAAPETIATHWLLHIPPGQTLMAHALYDTIHVKAADQVLDVEATVAALRTWTGTDGALDRLLLLLASLGILGVLTLALQDRLEGRRDGLATLRALGVPRRTLQLALLAESLAMTVSGLLIGEVLCRLTEPSVLAVLSGGGPWLFAANSPALLALPLWAAGAALLAALLGQLRLATWSDALLLRGI